MLKIYQSWNACQGSWEGFFECQVESSKHPYLFLVFGKLGGHYDHHSVIHSHHDGSMIHFVRKEI
jgi:hypothetical protein